MKTKLYTADGKQGKEMTLPSFFSTRVREDLIQKIIEAKKQIQPYAPSAVAGNQYSASGKLNHKRHVWKSQYGRGMSRIPRKKMSRRGTQFNWVGATVPNTRGGRRAHPPKAISMINTNKINKKEMKLALQSALAATVQEKYLTKRYETLANEKITNLPFIVEAKFLGLKTKEMVKTLKTMFGEALSKVKKKKKSIRAGIGKLRGRKYKKSLGVLIVVGNEEKLKVKEFDVVNANKLSINDLANGGAGRLTIYTENAIKDLEAKFK